MKATKERIRCRWCSRDDVQVTAKGGLAPHVTASGSLCVGVGIAVAPGSRTPPRRIKGATQRNQHRREARS